MHELQGLWGSLPVPERWWNYRRDLTWKNLLPSLLCNAWIFSCPPRRLSSHNYRQSIKYKCHWEKNCIVYICIKHTYQRLSQKLFFGGGEGSGLLKTRWRGRASDRDLAGERTIFTLSLMASGFLISSKQKQLDFKHVGGNNCRDSCRYFETGLRLSSRI